MITLQGEFKGFPSTCNSGVILRDLSVPVKVWIYNGGLESLQLSSVTDLVLESGESSGEFLVKRGETLYWSGGTKFLWKISFDQSIITFGEKDKDVLNSGFFIQRAKTTILLCIKNLGGEEPIILQGAYSEQIYPNKEITLILEKGSSLSWTSKSHGVYQLAEVGYIMEKVAQEVNIKPK